MLHRILIPFELPGAAPVSGVLADDIAGMEIVALGHFALPEQTPPEAGRDQFLDEAEAELNELIRPLADRGADVTTRLVFGRDRAKTVDRVAVEEGCDVVFTPGDGDPAAIDKVFVPLRGEENFEGLLSFVAELATECDASVTLFHDAEESDRLPGDQLLADAVEELLERGLDRDRIGRQLAEAGEVAADIVERAGAFDAVVLGESEPSLRDRLLGSRPAGITLNTDRPAFVVGTPERRE